jgi:hypothetical protein
MWRCVWPHLHCSARSPPFGEAVDGFADDKTEVLIASASAWAAAHAHASALTRTGATKCRRRRPSAAPRGSGAAWLGGTRITSGPNVQAGLRPVLQGHQASSVQEGGSVPLVDTWLPLHEAGLWVRRRNTRNVQTGSPSLERRPAPRPRPGVAVSSLRRAGGRSRHRDCGWVA